MPEIFTEDVEILFKAAQRTINDVINELHWFDQHRHRTPGASGLAWMADVRTKANAAGVDLTEWLGRSKPRLPK